MLVASVAVVRALNAALTPSCTLFAERQAKKAAAQKVAELADCKDTSMQNVYDMQPFEDPSFR